MKEGRIEQSNFNLAKSDGSVLNAGTGSSLLMDPSCLKRFSMANEGISVT